MLLFHWTPFGRWEKVCVSARVREINRCTNVFHIGKKNLTNLVVSAEQGSNVTPHEFC